MIIEKFKADNIPRHISDYCSVYIDTDTGIFPAHIGNRPVRAKELIDNFDFNIAYDFYSPIMSQDNKFEEEKIIIYQSGEVIYRPQRKLYEDDETEFIYRDRTYRK